jgi:hypothetical protein
MAEYHLGTELVVPYAILSERPDRFALLVCRSPGFNLLC